MMRQVYGKHGASSLSNGYANGHDASAVGSGASDIIFHPDFAKAQENQKAQSIAGTMTQAKRSDLAVANGPNTTTIAAQVRTLFRYQKRLLDSRFLLGIVNAVRAAATASTTTEADRNQNERRKASNSARFPWLDDRYRIG